MSDVIEQIQVVRQALDKQAADIMAGAVEVVAPELRKMQEQIGALERRLVEVEQRGVQYLGGHQRAADYRRGSP